MQKFPPQFFWKIETLWERFFLENSCFTDFSDLKQKYENQKKIGDDETNNNSSLQKFFLEKFPNFTPSAQTVFEDEKTQKFLGLDRYTISFQDDAKPVYVCDNHHEVLFPFWEISEFQKKYTNVTPLNPLSQREVKFSGLTVVHIDAHRDDAIFPYKIPSVETRSIVSLSEKNIQKIISQCRVSDYLDAGKKIGLISTIISVTQESEFQKFLEYDLAQLQKNKTPYILNLDIDIYGPEGTAVSTELKTEVIAKAWANADAVCFATSPGFIDSNVAAKLGKIMF